MSQPAVNEYAQQNSAIPVPFPCSDGGKVSISDFAYAVLKTLPEWRDIDRVKVVKAGGKRYLYTPVAIPDTSYSNWYFNRQREPRVMAWDRFLAYNVLFLHQSLPGDGLIIHDGSNSFLPSNYSRQEFPEHDQVEEPAQEKPRRVAVVGPEVIANQIKWLGSKELILKARACATKKTTKHYGEEIVQRALLVVLKDIQDGQVRAETQENLFAYTMRVLRNMCCDFANDGMTDDAYQIKSGEQRTEFPENI